MTRVVPIVLATWLCLATGSARAHAPIPRRVVLTPDASAIALSLPGFGLLFRARSEQPFVYVCDALLGLKPSDAVPSLAFLSDGALLLGSVDGVRRLTPDGCPRTEVVGELATAAVMTMAVQRGATETAYAVASGSAAGLWRSLDGGKHWELRSKVEQSELTNALVVSSSDASRVYLSMRTTSGATLFASADGGASLTKSTHELGLTLLSADGRAPYPLWAVARDAMTVGNRGVAILRAESAAGPWQPMLRVNYFGGLVIDAQGVIWVGDEIGGIYRSDNGGDSFQNLESDADVSCLASAGDALWACTPGTPKEVALQKLSSGQPRSDIVSFAAVDRLATCPELDVAKSCASAWTEWQRDVRMLPLSGQDAGTPTLADAGATDAEAADATVAEPEPVDATAGEDDHDEDVADAAAMQPSAPSARSDCSLRSEAIGSGDTQPTGMLPTSTWLIGLLLVLRRFARNSPAL